MYKLNLIRHSTIMKCSVQRPISSVGWSVSLQSLFTVTNENIIRNAFVSQMNQFHERHAIYHAFVQWKRSNEFESLIQSTKLPRLYYSLFYVWFFFSAVDLFFLMTIKRGNRLFMKYEKWKKPNHKNENNAIKHMHCTISHHTHTTP